MIPDEAVQAATDSVIKSLRALELGWVDTDMPDGVTIDVRDFDITAAITAALNAAAPHLMAAAWDEGYKTALIDQEYYSVNPNPYRTPTDSAG